MKRFIAPLLAAALCCASFANAATFGTITASGDTDTVTIKGPFIFKASGTWGSGTFTVYYKGADNTYQSFVVSTAHTSDATGQLFYDIPLNKTITVKATLSGATSPSLRWEFVGETQGSY